MTSDFPRTVTVRSFPGISAKIYRSRQSKEGKEYVSYVVSYAFQGRRKLKAFADLSEADAAAQEAIKEIARGDQSVIQLTGLDASEYVAAKAALDGKGTILEACREYARRHGSADRAILITEAVNEMIAQEESQRRGKRKGGVTNH